uniref:Uncharacterized protein MANES_02G084200 n=1 Tax=Rhizophora mucronata TaxID=61149 RepID=A0A2P2JNF2_RHIMU
MASRALLLSSDCSLCCSMTCSLTLRSASSDLSESISAVNRATWSLNCRLSWESKALSCSRASILCLSLVSFSCCC